MSKLLLVAILIAALFVRVYRVSELLGFYFDQGRDALVIWDLWHKGDLFLVGPTTGIDGILLGPFYYYFIAPFYLLGNGNPIWPAIWLAIVNVAAIFVIYKIGQKYFNTATGILAAIFISFSFYLVIAHRWLSNPTPLPLFSAIVVWIILELVHGSHKRWLWPALGLGMGLSLQLEAASAVFFLPAIILIFTIYRRSIQWHRRSLILAAIFFGITLIPQITFNFLKNNILLKSFHKFLVAEKSFQAKPTEFLPKRLLFYKEIFTNKFVRDSKVVTIFIVAVALLGIISFPHLKSKATTVFLIWWLVPSSFILFYHGNYGYVWDYYFTGIYSFLALLLAAILATAYQKIHWSRGIVVFLIGLFIHQNLPILKNYLTAGTDGPTHITLGPSLAAVDWIYQEAGDTLFNVDVYVPPVIPHAYDYLFLWRGSTKYHQLPAPTLEPRLYTLYEVDPPHPERLEAWLARQRGIAVIEAKIRFGGIHAQRRTRITP